MAAPKEKQKITVWMYPETCDNIEMHYRGDGCTSRSLFIEKAVRFYIGYLMADKDITYLPNAFLSNLKNVVMESEKRQKRELEFLAIEIALIETIMAATNGVSKETADRLRGDCEKMLRKHHGRLKYEHVADWQNGDN